MVVTSELRLPALGLSLMLEIPGNGQGRSLLGVGLKHHPAVPSPHLAAPAHAIIRQWADDRVS